MTTNEVLEQVDKEIIIEIMEDLGSPCYGTGLTSDGTDYLMFRTICHDGDSHKLWWYENTKRFQCWTCCGSMSVFDLVSKVRHCKFIESFYYVAHKAGIDLGREHEGFGETISKRVKLELAEMERAKELMNRNYSGATITKFYDPQILNYFDPTTFYRGWIDEHIEIETMQKYNIRFYYLESHIIIPHYDIDGNLVGIRRRSLNPDDSRNKYMPEFIEGKEYAHPLGLNLYGIDKNKEAIRKNHTAMLFEGEKSVLQCDSYYGDNSVALATCGFNVTDTQIRLLKKLQVDTVYLGFDKDFDIKKENEYLENPITKAQYLHYRERLNNLARKLSSSFKVYIIYDLDGKLDLKDSPTDKGEEEFKKLLQNAKLFVNRDKKDEKKKW